MQVLDAALVRELLPGNIKLSYYPSVSSTNDVARQLLSSQQASAESHLVVTAEQTEGRGRRGRQWLSGHWGLAFSLGLQLPLSAAGMLPVGFASLSPAVALGVCAGMLQCLPNAALALKWPNDVYLNDAKCVGILLESTARATQLQLVIGIGVNLAPPHTVAQQLQRAITGVGELLLRQKISLEQLLVSITNSVLHTVDLHQNQGFQALQQQWQQRDWLQGQKIVIDGVEQAWQQGQIGQYKGIDAQGRLLIECDDGTLRTVDFGEVSVRRTLTP